MKKDKQTKILRWKKLRAYMNSIPYGEYNNTISRMVDACNVTRCTWQNWVQGKCSIPDEAATVIESVAGIKIF